MMLLYLCKLHVILPSTQGSYGFACTNFVDKDLVKKQQHSLVYCTSKHIEPYQNTAFVELFPFEEVCHWLYCQYVLSIPSTFFFCLFWTSNEINTISHFISVSSTMWCESMILPCQSNSSFSKNNKNNNNKSYHTSNVKINST